MDALGYVATYTVTLPSGATQAFREHKSGKVFIGSTTQYYPKDQFDAALEKMRAAGAKVEIERK